MDRIWDLFTETQITFPVIVLRLTVSLLLGSIIGLERERHNQPAGFRTHSLIAIGSTMIMLLSIFMSQAFSEGSGGRGDPGRIAAQVVSGIGFLGAGAILRMGVSVKGVTTAASIWVVAALGLVVGSGMYGTAAVGTLFILVILIFFERMEKKIFTQRVWRSINLELKSNDIELNNVIKLFRKYRIEVQSSDISQAVGEKNTKVRFIVRIPKEVGLEALFEDLRSVKNVAKINLKGDI